MMRGILTVASFVSILYFPWPMTVLLALVSTAVEPLLPLVIGLFADTLYYVPSAHTAPFATLVGAIVTAVAFFVRSRLRAGNMRG